MNDRATYQKHTLDPFYLFQRLSERPNVNDYAQMCALLELGDFSISKLVFYLEKLVKTVDDTEQKKLAEVFHTAFEQGFNPWAPVADGIEAFTPNEQSAALRGTLLFSTALQKNLSVLSSILLNHPGRETVAWSVLASTPISTERTLLEQAATSPEIVFQLLEAGMPAATTDEKGRHLLHYQWKNDQLTQKLVEGGARMDQPDAAGMWPYTFHESRHDFDLSQRQFWRNLGQPLLPDDQLFARLRRGKSNRISPLFENEEALLQWRWKPPGWKRELGSLDALCVGCLDAMTISDRNTPNTRQLKKAYQRQRNRVSKESLALLTLTLVLKGDRKRLSSFKTESVTDTDLVHAYREYLFLSLLGQKYTPKGGKPALSMSLLGSLEPNARSHILRQFIDHREQYGTWDQGWPFLNSSDLLIKAKNTDEATRFDIRFNFRSIENWSEQEQFSMMALVAIELEKRGSMKTANENEEKAQKALVDYLQKEFYPVWAQKGKDYEVWNKLKRHINFSLLESLKRHQQAHENQNAKRRERRHRT